MPIKLQPMADFVLVKPIKGEEISRGGIVLPDTAKEKPQEGKVLAVGPGRLSEEGNKIPMNIAIGDTIVYSKYGGSEITIDGEDLILMHETDILARKTT
jgi:chaperonin GroES